MAVCSIFHPSMVLAPTFNVADLSAYHNPGFIPSDPFVDPSDPPNDLPFLNPTPLPVQPAQKDYVEAILDDHIVSTRNGGIPQLLVHWGGHPASDSIWMT